MGLATGKRDANLPASALLIGFGPSQADDQPPVYEIKAPNAQSNQFRPSKSPGEAKQQEGAAPASLESCQAPDHR